MKTFKELYHARIAWNQQSNIPSVEEGQIVELSKKDYDHAQKIINDPKTKGGNYGQAVKDLEKWKKGSTKDKKIAKMLYKAHNEQVHGYDDNPDGKKKNESVEHINEAKFKEIEVNWDMDDPREYQGDFQDVGVYLQKWDKKNATIIVQGDEKDLMNWLMGDFGMDKREAQQTVRKGKKVKEETETFDEKAGKYAKYSDLLMQKAKLVAQGPVATKEVGDINKKIQAEIKKLGIKEETN